MIGIRRTQVLPTGVDIGSDTVRLLQLEVVSATATATATTGSQLAVLAAARLALPEETRQQPQLRLPVAMDLIRRAMRSGEFSGRGVVAALPRELVHVKNLRLPQMPLNELASAVEFEARNVFPFDTDAAQIRFLHAGEVRQGNDARAEVIVLAAKNADVDDYLEQLHRAGLVVESLDFEPAAIYRSVERFIRRREDEHEVNVLVDIGGRRSQVIIGRGRDISFYKTVDIGAQHLHESVARKLGVSIDEAHALRRRVIESQAGDVAVSNGVNSGSAAGAACPVFYRDPVHQAVFDASRSVMEELAREIALCLRYHSVTFRGQRPTCLRLTGIEAGDVQLQAVLAANLPLPVAPLRPLHSVDMSRMKSTDRGASMSDWTTAFGLALKATTTHFGNRDGKRRDPNSSRFDPPAPPPSASAPPPSSASTSPSHGHDVPELREPVAAAPAGVNRA
jgi:type IV pilus assembly protein PilM